MDLDLAQVRAFVVTAEHLHFGQAAGELFLTQQALSKRIARLEETIGVRLFDRTGHSVRLTPAGERFLEPARRTLTAAETAVAAARHDDRPLRLDVWGHMFAPMQTIREVVDRRPDLDIELSLRRGLAAATSALLREETDVGFGRVHAQGEGLPEALTHRLVRLQPMAAVLNAQHPLAGEAELRPADLREVTVWFPVQLEKLDFLQRLCDDFGLTGEFGGVNLGLDYFLDHLRSTPEHVSLLPLGLPLPEDAGVRAIPLVDPVPLYSWSLIWRANDQHPLLQPLLGEFARAGREQGWTRYDPERHWLPASEVGQAGKAVPPGSS
ncbi:LysR family transcriptional regulator [Actinomadura barringtoniae]|uniref:LysR family transcriptional regulator n=1 Tax=Actinomadura barringtoniae TaxID=1427535 RepID=A0A939T9H4_9ACTN|nr:LysR family transcriptional regulator [Actinomadura barringtoniae]MBO2451387.1 LysR family transcriptional regulator [Actinomadura barringtoniae]